MSQKGRLLDVFEGKRYQKLVLVICVFTFLVLELLIYLTAASQAGQKSRIIITDMNGTKVYETAGNALTSYEKLVFENNFGPLQNYRMHLNTETFPFPFRAWLSAAVGIPIGLTLLVAFLVRAYISLLYGEEREELQDSADSSPGKNRMGSIFNLFRGISVFHIGSLVVVAVLLFWIVPNFLQDFATVSVSAIREYKWFFLGTAVFLALLIIWSIYLRYRLSKQMLENQLNIEKFRMETQLLVHREPSRLLPNPMNEGQEP